MEIARLIWLRDIVDKLEWKHQVSPDEVEDVLMNKPRFRRMKRGQVRGEDIYGALGQTQSGRYLSVFFIKKPQQTALVISAREMDAREREQYERR